MTQPRTRPTLREPHPVRPWAVVAGALAAGVWLLCYPFEVLPIAIVRRTVAPAKGTSGSTDEPNVAPVTEHVVCLDETTSVEHVGARHCTEEPWQRRALHGRSPRQRCRRHPPAGRYARLHLADQWLWAEALFRTLFGSGMASCRRLHCRSIGDSLAAIVGYSVREDLANARPCHHRGVNR